MAVDLQTVKDTVGGLFLGGLLEGSQEAAEIVGVNALAVFRDVDWTAARFLAKQRCILRADIGMAGIQVDAPEADRMKTPSSSNASWSDIPTDVF